MQILHSSAWVNICCVAAYLLKSAELHVLTYCTRLILSRHLVEDKNSTLQHFDDDVSFRYEVSCALVA